MYATGADQKKTDSDGQPGATTPWGTTSRKVKSYVLPPAAETGGFEEGFVYYNNFAADIINYHTSGTGTWGGVSGNGYAARGGVGGTWMAKLYGKYKVAPWYQIHLQAMYIGDTTKNGNTSGNAIKIGTSPARPRDDSFLGIELGWLNTFNIYKNLTLHVAAGWLVPGDALEYYDSVRNKNVEPEDPWHVQTRLLYTF
jgi:hypothetical protein